jgi:hypothetical protein
MMKVAKNSTKEQGAMSAASVFKAIDNVLKKPGCGCSGSLDYMEQSSWLLFLRYLDAREEERKLEARMNGKVYEPALPRRLRWSEWAYPLDAEGKLENADALKKAIEKDWADFKVTTRTKGAEVDNPNKNNPGSGANPRAAELAKKFYERRYGTAPAKDGANNNNE